MAVLSSMLALAAIALPALVAGADETCLAFLPEWECDVCGGYDASAPIVCAPYNATFDDLHEGTAVGEYNSAIWANFQVATDNPSTPDDINTASPPNYAWAPAGQTGNLVFTGPFPFGRLYAMSYACVDADPTSLEVQRSCNVNVTAKCQPTISQPDPAQETTETFSFCYQPEGPHVSNEALVRGFPPYDNGVCTSYTFEATGVNGEGVGFVVDEVLYNSYQRGAAGK